MLYIESFSRNQNEIFNGFIGSILLLIILVNISNAIQFAKANKKFTKIIDTLEELGKIASKTTQQK